MDVFELRNRILGDYERYVGSFVRIQDERIRGLVTQELQAGLLWPDPLIQMNPAFAPGESIDELAAAGVLHSECRNVFRLKGERSEAPKPLRLHRHQAEAVKLARTGANYVLTTGTGSGKSLAYIIPIVDFVLRNGPGRGIKAIVVYPMNALANSQMGELDKFLKRGYPDGRGPLTFARYTGQDDTQQRQEIIAHPPDIVLTNYVMLELLLTRPYERQLIQAGAGLRFLVLDELHTYRGRQGADVAMLVRRTRDAFQAKELQCIGTSATLATEGSFEAQRRDVARVASLLFGAAVEPGHVIGETLRRTTPEHAASDPDFLDRLRARIQRAEPPADFDAFLADPLSSWIETTFGLRKEPGTDRLVRSTPRSLTGDDGAAKALSALTGVSEDLCVQAITRHLLAGYRAATDPDTGFPLFAFRLHQFISRGDTVYASIEPESARHITVHGQQFVPGDRSRVLVPLVFCRECGQEYYCVRRLDGAPGGPAFVPRELNDRLPDEESTPGFLYLNTAAPWPEDTEEVFRRLPEDWIEEHRGKTRIRSTLKDKLPRAVRVAPDGTQSDAGVDCHFIPAPFRFCPTCDVAYSSRQQVDFGKLASLGTEGRSTATTILALSAVRYLRADRDLAPEARKLLSFTDNRQDASLQAGHFNDFVEIGLLRSALFRAARAAGPEGLAYDTLVQRVFNELDLPLRLYASDPEVQLRALEETRKAFREVLEYRIYRDLERGWRITLPNLEQCGLLEIKYLSLEDLCRGDEFWQEVSLPDDGPSRTSVPVHPALRTAKPEARIEVAKTLLDFMRRGLAIRVNCLDGNEHDRIRNASFHRLRPPWAIDPAERMQRAAVLFPRASTQADSGEHIYLSARSGFGQYLRRDSTFPDLEKRLTTAEAETVCRQLLAILRKAGCVAVAMPPREKDDVPGYQLDASALRWCAADGTRPFHDPIRVPRLPKTGGHTNKFFVEFYQTIAAEGAGLEAREHTAQVRYEDRVERERRFREGALPILFCSPTMELGVDIKDLNVVNLRNIPPTPANYAQRSGRAGRSGQPALVFSYCSSMMPHDQYFFKRPERMVAGAVSPPRIDLANQDLLRAHIHAIWLSESKLGLGSSLADVLQVTGEKPTLAPQTEVEEALKNEAAREQARRRAIRMLESIKPELAAARWCGETWIDDVLRQIERSFNEACERWRTLYRAASAQVDAQHRIIQDASRSREDRDRARRLRNEAEAQRDLLLEAQNVMEADFYSYRYFASEGFLPGYSFPRLPLSAYIPGRRERTGRNEFVSRPRFLAISEFGPRAIVYHEGSRYRINKVMLPLRGDNQDLVTHTAKRCDRCGYFHMTPSQIGPDLCERCQAPLGAPLVDLMRLQNVSTTRADRINSDEEERVRIGYEIQTAIRFAEQAAGGSRWFGSVECGGARYARLTYGHAATLWRVNLGWRRRANPEEKGFRVDTERGYWERNQRDDLDTDEENPMSNRTKRVIPYVEDRRNCLVLEFEKDLDQVAMASLQAALENAIQIEYQLEDSELASEALPSPDDRRSILFYEAAEGGAGVLRRLLDEPAALAQVARRALDLCHFDPATGADRGRAEHARTACEAACYDCLMSYTNQTEHKLLDRKRALPVLRDLAGAAVRAAPAPVSPDEHYQALLRQCASTLEERWLNHLWEHKLLLPSHAQYFIESVKTRPDFFYSDRQAAVYIDGPVHEYPERQARDAAQTAAMADRGYSVIRFTHDGDWDAVFARYPDIFGRPA
ncbi:MAG TPA: hypothetical protein DCM87_13775 [Planctomycetes bacterium]|nr:hypothetical protein [Planctomycetota bacterium]